MGLKSFASIAIETIPQLADDMTAPAEETKTSAFVIKRYGIGKIEAYNMLVAERSTVDVSFLWTLRYIITVITALMISETV